jgi:hypothetical protein
MRKLVLFCTVLTGRSRAGGTSKNKKKNKGFAKTREENGRNAEELQDASTEPRVEGTPDMLDPSVRDPRCINHHG